MTLSPTLLNANQSYPVAKVEAENCTVLDINISIARIHRQLITYDTEQVLYLVHAAGFIPVLFVIGAPLNVLNLVVFFRQGLADRINVCLFALSLLDLVYLVVVFVYSAARAYWRWENGEWADPVYRFIFETVLIGFYGIGYGPYFLSAIISTERCVCIMFPLQARRCISTKALVMVILAGEFVVIGLFFFIMLQYRVICVFVEYTQTNEWAISFSEFYFKNKAIVDVIEEYFFGFTVVIGSTVVVLLTTVITAIKLQCIMKWRGKATSSSITLSNKEIGVIKTIIYLSIEFIILSLPKLILRLAEFIDDGLGIGGVYRHSFMVLVNMSELSSYVSSVVNFFVYYCSGSKYRETLHSLLPFGKTPCSGSK